MISTVPVGNKLTILYSSVCLHACIFKVYIAMYGILILYLSFFVMQGKHLAPEEEEKIAKCEMGYSVASFLLFMFIPSILMGGGFIMMFAEVSLECQFLRKIKSEIFLG